VSSTRWITALEDDCRTLPAGYMRDRAKLVAVADRIGDTKGHTPPAEGPTGQLRASAGPWMRLQLVHGIDGRVTVPSR
jgi:hypothetical protein